MNRVNEEEKLRDSLMEWYLRFGERVINVEKLMNTWGWVDIRIAWDSPYIRGCGLPPYKYQITPEGLAYMKEK